MISVLPASSLSLAFFVFRKPSSASLAAKSSRIASSCAGALPVCREAQISPSASVPSRSLAVKSMLDREVWAKKAGCEKRRAYKDAGYEHEPATNRHLTINELRNAHQVTAGLVPQSLVTSAK